MGSTSKSKTARYWAHPVFSCSINWFEILCQTLTEIPATLVRVQSCVNIAISRNLTRSWVLFGSVKCLFCLEGMLGRVVDAYAGIVHVGVDALLGPDDLDEVGLEGEPLGLRQEAQVELAVLDLALGVVPHRGELYSGGIGAFSVEFSSISYSTDM